VDGARLVQYVCRGNVATSVLYARH
jgi:hypothetical protein